MTDLFNPFGRKPHGCSSDDGELVERQPSTSSERTKKKWPLVLKCSLESNTCLKQFLPHPIRLAIEDATTLLIMISLPFLSLTYG